MVAAIVTAVGPRATYQATEALLVRAGISVGVPGRVKAAGTAPQAPALLLPFQVVAMGLEARNRAEVSRMTLVDYAEALRSLGMTFPADTAPGDRMRDLLASWVQAARRHPQSPVSFTPLALAELARRQAPSVDLAEGRYDPASLRLGLLDLELIGTGLLRGVEIDTSPQPEVSVAPARARARQIPRYAHRPDRAHALVRPVAWSSAQVKYSTQISSKECSDVKKALIGVLPMLPGAAPDRDAARETAAGQGFGKLQEAVIAQLEKELPDRAQRIARHRGKAMEIVQLSLRVVNLAAFYSLTHLELRPNPGAPQHRPVGTAKRRVNFDLTVGISDPEWQELHDLLEETSKGQQSDPWNYGSYRDCLRTLGLPLWDTRVDLARKLVEEKWGVRFVLGSTPQDLALWTPSDPLVEGGQVTAELRPVGKARGTARLPVDLTPEAASLHQRGVSQETGYVYVTAELRTNKSATFETLISSWIGVTVEGLDNLVRILAAPKVTASLPVTYHAGQAWIFDHGMRGGHVQAFPGRRAVDYRVYGEKCGGLTGEWTLNIAGLVNYEWSKITEGSITVTIRPDLSGAFHGKGKGYWLGGSQPLRVEFLFDGLAHVDFAKAELVLAPGPDRTAWAMVAREGDNVTLGASGPLGLVTDTDVWPEARIPIKGADCIGYHPAKEPLTWSTDP